MITEQHQQHWLRDLGLLTQPARETTEPKRSKHGRTKTPRQAYCRLTREQMQKLIEYITPHAQSYIVTAQQIYKMTPNELLTDTNGNPMKWYSFLRMIENIRKPCETEKPEQKKYTIIRLMTAGLSASEITNKHPNISEKYAKDIIRELKKSENVNVSQ